MNGFTLIEVLTTIAIIGILAAIAVSAYLNQANKARYAAAESIARSFAVPLWEHRLEHGSFPPDVDNDRAPAGLAGAWVLAADAPFRSAFDYDHHNRGDGVCLVLITFFGINQRRDSRPYTAIASADDRVYAIAEYSCEGAAGSVR